MSKFRTIVIVLYCHCIPALLFAQEEDEMPEYKIHYKTYAVVIDGDTMPSISLPEVYIYAEYAYSTKKDIEAWTRTKYNVKKVYPYAILAAAKLKEYDLVLERLPDEKSKKAYMKIAEKELKEQFGSQLRDLSINQGRILLKLIDRETGNTSYKILKEYRGGFQAFMWQSLAKLFGNNMKSEYDPSGDDIMIERAIKLIEAGQF